MEMIKYRLVVSITQTPRISMTPLFYEDQGATSGPEDRYIMDPFCKLHFPVSRF